MTLPTLLLDQTGNVEMADGQRFTYDAMLNTKIPAATQPYMVAGTGVPTFTAPKGTVYIRLDGSASTMMYINNNGATTWSVVTSA